MTKAILIGLLGFFLACSNGENVATNSGLGAFEAPPVVLEETQALTEKMMITNDISSSNQQTSIPREAKIIQTGYLSFESNTPEETHQTILDLVAANNGFVSSDNAGKNYNRIYRNMVVRVPTKNFQSLIDGISEGVNYFDEKTISRQDVTEEFVDLEARLNAKRELEQRYLELLKQAKNVKEMLEIERELSTIREEIEAKQGRLNYLQDQVSMSTVTIQFYKVTSETGVTLSYGQKIKNALKGGWDGISVFFIGILYLWPLWILIVLIALLVRWLIRRNKTKK
ncbi:MAG: DUF4349 domain-containing protein [Marinirhabdus sp.]|nr:DUF4349 domain-containing protein [Marinirhabdus sp.]